MKINIDKVLKENGKTRCWLAREAGITYPAIVNLCKNTTSSANFENLDKICKILNCEIQDILQAEK